MRVTLLPPTFESPSRDQLWSYLQRALSFDEPAVRWNKLLIHLSRHVAGKDLANLPLSEQAELFNRVFGPLGDQRSRNFSLQLALEDLQRFTSLSFDTWYYAFAHEDMAIVPQVSRLSEELDLSESQANWLNIAWTAAPDWHCLKEEGPWTANPLADFVVDVIEKLSERATHGAAPAEIIEVCRESFKNNLKDCRAHLPPSFQPNVLVLVEGPTEAVLLPRFAHLLHRKFSDFGILLIVCGGARQVERRYIGFADAVNTPIFVIIDGDAKEEIRTITDLLRPQDRLHAWLQGEIEDLLATPFLIQQINGYLAHLGEPGFVEAQEVTSRAGRTPALNRLWRERGLGDFDKVGFAEFIAEHMTRQDVPAEAASVIRSIATVAGLVLINPAGIIAKDNEITR